MIFIIIIVIFFNPSRRDTTGSFLKNFTPKYIHGKIIVRVHLFNRYIPYYIATLDRLNLNWRKFYLVRLKGYQKIKVKIGLNILREKHPPSTAFGLLPPFF